jgi:hypothetical protein
LVLGKKLTEEKLSPKQDKTIHELFNKLMETETELEKNTKNLENHAKKAGITVEVLLSQENTKPILKLREDKKALILGLKNTLRQYGANLTLILKGNAETLKAKSEEELEKWEQTFKEVEAPKPLTYEQTVELRKNQFIELSTKDLENLSDQTRYLEHLVRYPKEIKLPNLRKKFELDLQRTGSPSKEELQSKIELLRKEYIPYLERKITIQRFTWTNFWQDVKQLIEESFPGQENEEKRLNLFYIIASEKNLFELSEYSHYKWENKNKKGPLLHMNEKLYQLIDNKEIVSQICKIFLKSSYLSQIDLNRNNQNLFTLFSTVITNPLPEDQAVEEYRNERLFYGESIDFSKPENSFKNSITSEDIAWLNQGEAILKFLYESFHEENERKNIIQNNFGTISRDNYQYLSPLFKLPSDHFTNPPYFDHNFPLNEEKTPEGSTVIFSRRDTKKGGFTREQAMELVKEIEQGLSDTLNSGKSWHQKKATTPKDIVESTNLRLLQAQQKTLAAENEVAKVKSENAENAKKVASLEQQIVQTIQKMDSILKKAEQAEQKAYEANKEANQKGTTLLEKGEVIKTLQGDIMTLKRQLANLQEENQRQSTTNEADIKAKTKKINEMQEKLQQIKENLDSAMQKPGVTGGNLKKAVQEILNDLTDLSK